MAVVYEILTDLKSPPRGEAFGPGPALPTRDRTAREAAE